MRLVYGIKVLNDPPMTLAEYGITPPCATITVVRVPPSGCTVTFQAERFNPGFPLASTILGERGENLWYIFNRSGRPIQLRVREGNQVEPMFLWLPYLHSLGLCECWGRPSEEYDGTIGMVTDLLDRVCVSHNAWALEHNLPQ